MSERTTAISTPLKANLRKYLAEVIGTYILVFTGTGAAVVNEVTGGTITHVGIALSFGLVVLAMIYTIGEISGAHMNPAVSIGFWFAKRFSLSQVTPYVVSQCLGALLASATLRVLFMENAALGGTHPAGSYSQSFVLEFLLTAFLMFVVLNVTSGSKETGVMAGIAIGSLIALEAMFAGPICGASMNPARSLGPAVVSGMVSDLWIYLLAPVLGSLFGVLCFWGVKDPKAKT